MSAYCPWKAGMAISQECVECEDRLCHEDVFYILVAGTRTYTNYEFFAAKMDMLLSRQKKVMVVSGGAHGVDAMAARYAEDHGCLLKEFPADWSRGNRAGYERNRAMHEYIAHFAHRGCVLFWDGKSKGTRHSIALAREFGTELKVIKICRKEKLK